jgi:hypothetical protein
MCELEEYDVSFDLTFIDLEKSASNPYEFEVKFQDTGLTNLDRFSLIFRENIKDDETWGTVFGQSSKGTGTIYAKLRSGQESETTGRFTEGRGSNFLLKFNFRQGRVSVYQDNTQLADVPLGNTYNTFNLISFQYNSAGAKVFLDDVVIGGTRIQDNVYTPDLADSSGDTGFKPYSIDNGELTWKTDWYKACGANEMRSICTLRLQIKYLLIDNFIVPMLTPIKDFAMENILIFVLALILVVLLIVVIKKVG